MAKIWTILISFMFFSMGSNATIAPTSDILSFTFLGKRNTILCEKNKIQRTILLLEENRLDQQEDLSNKLSPISDFIQKQQNALQLPDWLTYQLIRRIAEQLNSKYVNYKRYTYTKFALLKDLGFEPLLFKSSEKILLYIKSQNTIYNLPNKMINGLQYVCLNYHDYEYQINFSDELFYQIIAGPLEPGKNFDYTINHLPSFQEISYSVKQISFNYKHHVEAFKVLVHPEMQDYFTNYPVTEYRYQFNIPFSKISYNSLIPELKKRLEKLKVEEGVEYLMLFVRDGFEFETDTKLFGREKRFSPEETLTSNSSDCEDRSALFFLLVKEIYDLPMAVLSYPEHVNVAVLLPKKKGKTVQIDDNHFTICEPTPQKKNRGIGWIPKEISNQPFEIAYVYKK